MKSDARYLLNKKKWKNQLGKRAEESWRNRKIISRHTVDARKIINSKRRNADEILTGFRKNVSKSNPLVRKQFSTLSKASGKQVQLSRDGNIWITSRSKTDASSIFGAVQNPSPKMGITVSSRNKPLQRSYEPWKSDVDDLEHIGIDDLMDMDSLPPAVLSPKIRSESKSTFPRKSLAEQVLAMNNTMVADQELAAAVQQSVTVYVTNLRSSVSKQDIIELFGDVGQIRTAELCNPGTAVIEFFSQEDAEKACEIYHNRLLDGQPMKCCIQPNLRPSRTSVSQRLGDRIEDSAVSHLPITSSQASSSRSRYNPRNVQFTVKLT